MKTRTVRWAGLACLVLGLAAGANWLGANNGEKPAAARVAKQEVAKRLPLWQVLATTVDTGGLDDPKTTLLEALDQYAKVHRVSFDVRERAFKAEGLNDVLKTYVAETPIPPMRATLAMVINKVLARVPVASGACFLVRDDIIEITTGAAVRDELGLPRWTATKEGELPPPLHLISREIHKLPLARALEAVASASGANVVLDSRCEKQGETVVSAKLLNVTAATAVEVLADQAGLDVVRIENVYYVTSEENAERLRKRHAQRPKAAEAPKAPTAPAKP